MPTTTTSTVMDDPTNEQVAGGNFFGGINAMMMTMTNGYGHCGNGTEWCTENLVSSIQADPNANSANTTILDAAALALRTAWTTATTGLNAPPVGYAYCIHLTADGPRLLLKVV